MEELREQYDSFTIPTNGEDTEDEKSTISTTETDGKRQLVGYCAIWGAVSDVRRDGFRHRFQRGSIKWADPTNVLWNHDYGSPLASTGNSTAKIEEDDYGAKVTIDIDDTTDGENAFQRVKSRLVQGMSFGGKRLAYDRTDDPKIIEVTSFVAEETSLTIIPGMAETKIVPAANADELEKQKTSAAIAANQKMQRAALDRSRLTIMTAGRASSGKKVQPGK